MTKNSKTLLIAQPILLGHSYNALLIKNKYQVKTNNQNNIKDMLTSYPYIRFTVPHETQVIIKETRKEPITKNLCTSPKFKTVQQVGSLLVLSTSIPMSKDYGWEPLLENDNTQVIVDNEPVYKQKVLVPNQLIQFIPANAHIWSVLNLCTTDGI